MRPLMFSCLLPAAAALAAASPTDHWIGTVDLDMDSARSFKGPAGWKETSHFHASVDLLRLSPHSWTGTATGSVDYYWQSDESKGHVKQGSDKATVKASLSINDNDGTYRLHVNGASFPCKFSEHFVSAADPRNPLHVDNETMGTCKTDGASIEATLPAGGGALTSGGSYVEVPLTPFRAMWSLRGPADKIQADPGGPYQVSRGEAVQLDGSRSQGAQTYRWTFTDHCPGGPVADASVVLTTAKAEVKLLCDTEARLEVSDGTKTDTKTALIRVTPRPWKTPIDESSQGEGAFRGTKPWVRIAAGVQIEQEAGVERCALDGQAKGVSNPASTEEVDRGNHIFHPAPKAGATYEHLAYELEPLGGTGPYAKVWWASRMNDGFRVARRIWLNAYVLPGGPACYAGMASLYDANVSKGNQAAIDAMLQDARAHEQLHSSLVIRAVRSCDPMRKIEAGVAKDEGSLAQKEDGALRRAEEAVTNYSDDPLSTKWMGKLWRPREDTGEFVAQLVCLGGACSGAVVKGAPPTCDQ
ncbi:MAG TPA: hypothetical protein VN375_13350 [Vicinamibacteria bacterium]|jgi:hypothetical protein|nr:hypothetical protein [Vicinamibacteria bacterium]